MFNVQDPAGIMHYKKSHTSLIVAGAAIIMSLLSQIAGAMSGHDYHYLSENLVESETCEVRKLINGDIDAVLFNKDTNTVLVSAGGYLWKINEKGYVTDTLRGTRGLLNSGIQSWSDSWNNGSGERFSYKRFIDWLYAGSKSEQTVGMSSTQTPCPAQN
jgi:hypothetical protein